MQNPWNTYGKWRQQLDDIPLENAALTKSVQFKRVQIVFNKLHQLTSGLPEGERDRVLVALTKELGDFGIAFMAALSMHVVAVKLDADFQAHTDDDFEAELDKLHREKFVIISRP